MNLLKSLSSNLSLWYSRFLHISKLIKEPASLLLWILTIPSLIWSSNFHEHLFSLPFPSNIVSVAPFIFAFPSDHQQLSNYFDQEQDLAMFIAPKWDAESCKEFIRQQGYKKTITQLCQHMPGDLIQNLEKFLSFDSDSLTPFQCKQKNYIAIEKMRKEILLHLPKDKVKIIFEEYFKEEPLINRQFISASVTRRFFQADQENKYLLLQELATQYGSKLVYHISLQREELMNEGINFNNHILSLLFDHKIYALNVVGSLKEKDYSYTQEPLVISQRIKELFNFVSKHSIVLIFHLFEEACDDPFYAALKNVLIHYKKSLYLEIGHLAHINDDWLKILSSNPYLHVLFHANIRSNQELQGLSIEQLREKVLLIQKYGFSVVPGSDGRGILPRSSYQEQMHLLQCSLDTVGFLGTLSLD